MPLLLESLRPGCEWKEALRELMLSSSVDSRGDDKMLEDRFGNRDGGGTNPSESNEFFIECFSGELAKGELCS
jgi:hypothetical protein